MKKLLILLLVLLGLGFSYEINHESFHTVKQMTARLEKLNYKEYSTLKIFVIPSSRGMGLMGSPYNIIYKTDN